MSAIVRPRHSDFVFLSWVASWAFRLGWFLGGLRIWRESSGAIRPVSRRVCGCCMFRLSRPMPWAVLGWRGIRGEIWTRVTRYFDLLICVFAFDGPRGLNRRLRSRPHQSLGSPVAFRKFCEPEIGPDPMRRSGRENKSTTARPVVLRHLHHGRGEDRHGGGRRVTRRARGASDATVVWAHV